MSDSPTLEEIHREGLLALRERLGPAGMIRFLQQFETGSGDYAAERQDWVDRTTLDDIKQAAAAPPASPKRRQRK